MAGLQHFFHPSRRGPWLVLALILKALWIGFFLVYNHSEKEPGNYIAISHGDTRSYFEPIENLIATGHYTPDLRMPGYGAVYYMFRSIASPDRAKDLILLCQWIAAALATYLAARIAQRISRSDAVFVVVLLLLGCSPYLSTLEARLCTEGFCTAAFIACVWSLLRWEDDRRPLWMAAAGALIGWTVFLRPTMGLVLVLFAVLVPLRAGRGWRDRTVAVVLFLLPFLVADTAWTLRNWRVHHAFRPLANGLYYANPAGELNRAARALVMLYGGHIMYAEPRSHLNWFHARDVGDVPYPARDPLPPPDWFATPDFDRDSLVLLSRLTERALDLSLDSATSAPLLAEAIARYRRYAASAREHHPVKTTVLARLVCTWHFLWQFGSAGLFYNPWNESSLPAKAIKVLQGGVYLVTTFLGLLACVVRSRHWRREPLNTIGAIPWIVPAGILVFPLVFVLSEYRYLYPFHPFLVMLTVDLLQRRLRRSAVRPGAS